MTQLESGALKLHKELQCIKEVINTSLYNLAKQIGKRVINVHIPPEFPKIYFEPVLLEQVFIQLLDNAIKYSPPESPIDIKISSDKDNALVKVENQGEGLTVEEMKKVFDRFYRGRTSKVGMGLGLTICQSIIKAHGGLIWAENREGGGVIFCFTLPLKN
jgi:two-component system sensor histidine kinase KdpD